MHPAEIKHQSDRAARRAARDNKQPYVFFDVREVTSGCPPFPFPLLGGHTPSGWLQFLDEDLFVDISGHGRPSEPALTIDELKKQLVHLLEANKDETLGFAFSEAGQFQAHLRVFKRVKEQKSA